MKIAKATAYFLEDTVARNLSPRTRFRYAEDLRVLSTFLNQRHISQLHRVTTNVLRRYLAHLYSVPNVHSPENKLSPFTIEGRYRTVKTFFTFCHQEKFLRSNPMSLVRHPKTPKRIVNRLTEDQVTQLLYQATRTQSPARNLALLSLMLGCGLRRSETLQITLPQLDLDGRKLRIMGKGNKERVIPLSQGVTRTVRNWVRVRGENHSPRLFTTDDGTPLTANALQSLFRRINQHLGFPRLYPHLLRHTFAKLYLLRADPKSLQQILGHSRASTTLDLYVEFDFGDLQKINDRAATIDSIIPHI